MNNQDNGIILGKILVDYLRITTFGDNDVMANLFQRVSQDTIPTKRWNYTGSMCRKTGMYLGHGLQRNKRHWMFDIPGKLANALYPFLVTQEYYQCARIDLQQTLLESEVVASLGYSIEELGQKIIAAKPEEWTGKKPTVGYIDGLTISLGKRGTGLYRRIYRKILKGGVTAIRFENEYLTPYAKQVWVRQANDARFLSDWYGNFLKGVDLRFLGNHHKETWVREASTLDSQYHYARNTILPFIRERAKEYDLKLNYDSKQWLDALEKDIEDMFYGLFKVENSQD